jgi:hypothetical protein
LTASRQIDLILTKARNTEVATMPTSTDYWLTRPEVGERLKVPVATLAQWASQGKGPRFAKIGRWTRYRLEDVMAWENAQFGGDVA